MPIAQARCQGNAQNQASWRAIQRCALMCRTVCLASSLYQMISTSIGLPRESFITFGEIERGIRQRKTRDPEFAHDLRVWLDRTVTLFSDRLLPFEAEDALIWGHLSAKIGHTGADLMIAATGILHGAVIITGNVSDFAPTGLSIETRLRKSRHPTTVRRKGRDRTALPLWSGPRGSDSGGSSRLRRGQAVSEHTSRQPRPSLQGPRVENDQRSAQGGLSRATPSGCRHLGPSACHRAKCLRISARSRSLRSVAIVQAHAPGRFDRWSRGQSRLRANQSWRSGSAVRLCP